jgi:arginine decarboxylase
LWRTVKPLRERLYALSSLRLMAASDVVGSVIDPLRLTLRHAYLQANSWADDLEAEHHLAYELANTVSATYIAQIGHTPKDAVALYQGLTQLNKDYSIHGFTGDIFVSQELPPLPPVQCVLSPRSAFFAPQEDATLSDAIGRCSAQTVVSCPPGIPILHPGEKITEMHIPLLESHHSIRCVR